MIDSTSLSAIHAQRHLYSRMLDRLMQLIPRLAATDSARHPSIESFRDFRIALNVLDLRKTKRKIRADLHFAIDEVVVGVKQYFEQCVKRRERQPVPNELRIAIRTAVEKVSSHTTRASIEPPSPDENEDRLASERDQSASASGAKWAREALHALVGLQLSLFPPDFDITDSRNGSDE